MAKKKQQRAPVNPELTKVKSVFQRNVHMPTKSRAHKRAILCDGIIRSAEMYNVRCPVGLMLTGFIIEKTLDKYTHWVYNGVNERRNINKRGAGHEKLF